MKLPDGLHLLVGIIALVCFSTNVLAVEKIRTSTRVDILERISEQGSTRVIIELLNTTEPVNSRSDLSFFEQKQLLKSNIEELQRQAKAKLGLANEKLKREYNYIPFMVYEVDEEALTQLESLEDVVNIQLDNIRKTSLSESTQVIGSDNAWDMSYTGIGQTIAIIDSGVDKDHEFLAGKVVSEACYSTTSPDTLSFCPSGDDEVGDDTGLNCDLDGCEHGTHVAGIAAGDGDTFSGVAKGAELIAIQVFSAIYSESFCGSSDPCIGAYDSDVIQGLERVYELLEEYDIPSVNMSLGGSGYASQDDCDSANSAYLTAITNLVEAGVAVVVASGNDGYDGQISAPACVTGAISVGATNDDDEIASFTNLADFLTYLAPGVSIISSVPDNAYSSFNGTSMAAPHVAGAIAVLAAHESSPGLADILLTLTDSAQDVSEGDTTYARIQLDDALDLLSDSDDGTDGETVTLNLTVSVDNAEDIYVNGEFIESSSDWQDASYYSLEVSEDNTVIAIQASDAGGVAALIAELELDGESFYSDGDWKVSTEYQEDWQNVDFDDSQWNNATEYGGYGIAPWYTKVSGLDSDSQANWIWSENNTDDDLVYFRYTLSSSGGDSELAPVSIDTANLEEGRVNQAFSVQLIGSGGTESYIWSLTTGNLPDGLFLDSSSGEISGVPTTQGSSEFTITLEDTEENVASSDFTLDIAEEEQEPSTLNLTVSVDNAEDIYVNGEFIGSSSDWQDASYYSLEVSEDNTVIAIQASDAGGVAALIAELELDGESFYSDGDWKVSTEYQEDWQNVDFDDSQWSNATEYGSYGIAPWYTKVSYLSTDSEAVWIWSNNNTDDDLVYFRYTISTSDNVEEVDAVSIDTSVLDDGQVNQAYSMLLTGSGGTENYSWSVSSGALPDGLSLNNSSGEISGEPTTEDNYEFTITLEDTDSSSDNANFTINVVADESEEEQTSTLNLTISVDNSEDVYINGDYVGSASTWTVASLYSVKISAGTNVVAVQATDAGGVAALIVGLELDGESFYSDGDWKVSTEYQEDWQNVDFDDSQWSNATEYGSYGIAPWYTKVSGLDSNSQANWIWSDNNADDDLVYFRYTFIVE